ncbi:hypothetical protein ACTXT7_013460 [Hymenolepis weldensis]
MPCHALFLQTQGDREKRRAKKRTSQGAAELPRLRVSSRQQISKAACMSREVG